MKLLLKELWYCSELRGDGRLATVGCSNRGTANAHLLLILLNGTRVEAESKQPISRVSSAEGFHFLMKFCERE